MSSEHSAEQNNASNETQERDLTRSLVLERFGPPSATSSHDSRVASHEESEEAATLKPTRVRRRYRGWALASRGRR